MSPIEDPNAVAVFCASSLGKQEAFRNAAVSLGKALAHAKRPLVYGGGAKGIMGVVSGTVMEEGGEVVGILPYAMYIAGGEKEKTTTEIENGKEITIHKHDNERVKTIIVNSMHERKLEMASRCGGFAVLPGGFGTYEEVLEAITWTQLAIHNKPIVILNVLSFYSPLRDLIRNGVQQGFIQPSNEQLAIFVDGPADESEHATYNWGEATLRALNSWQSNDSSAVYTYDWSKRMGSPDTVGNSLRNV